MGHKVLRRSLALGAAALLTLRSVPAMVPWLPGGGHRPPPAAAAGRGVRLVWFRSDLRLHDNEALTQANEAASSLLPVFIFDPREFGAGRRPATAAAAAATMAGPRGAPPPPMDRSGPHRARFLLESVSELRTSLRALGSDLIVRVGHPEDVLPALVQELSASAVHCHSEPSPGEARLEAAVRSALRSRCGGDVELRCHWGGTLHAVTDLPFKLSAMPGSYGDFRTRLQDVRVRAALPRPSALKGRPVSSVEPGELPTLQQLGFDTSQCPLGPASLTGSSGLRGGEGQALAHLRAFLDEARKAGAAAATAAAAAASGRGPSSSSSSSSGAFSCKVSPWLAMGCLSPRLVYEEAAKLAGVGAGGAAAAGQAGPGQGGAGQQRQGGGSSGSWLVLELMWRDFFRLVTLKHTRAGLHGEGRRADRTADSRQLAMA